MSALTVSQVLDRAADLIEPEGAWIQHTLAKDSEGWCVMPSDLTAQCFCVRGAIAAAQGGMMCTVLGYDAEVVLAHDVLGITGGCSPLDVADYNDAPERTQPEVVAALRKAAALAREQGK